MKFHYLAFAAVSEAAARSGGSVIKSTGSLLLLSSLVSPAVTAASADASSSVETNEHAPLTNLASSLRGNPSSLADTKAIQDKLAVTPIEKLSLDERKDLVEDLRVALDKALGDFDAFKEVASKVPSMEWIKSLDTPNRNDAFDAITNLLALLEEAVDQQEYAAKELANPVAQIRYRRVLSRSKNDDKEEAVAHNQKMYRKTYRTNRHQVDRILSQNMGTHKASSIDSLHRNIQSSMLGGDPIQAMGATNTGQTHQDASRILWSSRRRHLMTANKKELCVLLAECVDGMSMYDFFVYIHSDDIDEDSGEIDEDIIEFDESDVVEKYQFVSSKASTILENRDNPQDSACDSLLQEFHRTIEQSGIPEWQGATVGQVCLAEGTTQYVRLQDMMDTVLRNAHINDLWTVNENRAEDMIGEAFRCAEELFYTSDRERHHQSESFVFVGCGGSNTANCALSSYELPADIDSSFVDPVSYGDRTYLQNNAMDFRWLSGARSTGGKSVHTMNMLESEYERTTARTTYEWILRSEPARSSVVDPKHGDCVKYGQTVFLQVNDSDRYWLSGERSGTGNVLTLDHLGSTYELNARLSYMWIVRSKFGDGRLLDQDPKHGQCVRYEDKLIFQANSRINRWLSGARGTGNAGVHTDDHSGHSGSSYEWIVRKERGDGSRVIIEKRRDRHGQLLGIEGAYTMTTYATMKANSDDCKAAVDADPPETATEKHEMYRECIADHINYGFGRALELVFGAKPSPGFICGIKEAVKTHNKKIPGYCCLDAPFELSGNAWGHEFDCSATCMQYGPYFSGLSEASCLSQGGTYCMNDSDCSELKTCISNMESGANNEGLTAFREYLRMAPNITDATNYEQCGHARNYFGFEKNFIHDQAICDDVEQLRLSKDFDFLQEFFGQGEDVEDPATVGTPKPLDDTAKTVEPFELEEIDDSSSESGPVQNGQAWRGTNFALRTGVDIAKDVGAAIEGKECPADLTGVVQTVCAGILNLGSFLAQIILIILRSLFDISGFTYGEVSEVGNVEPIKIFEATQAIYDHMVHTGEYAGDGFNLVLSEIARVIGGINGVNKHTTTSVNTVLGELFNYKGEVLAEIEKIKQFHGIDAESRLLSEGAPGPQVLGLGAASNVEQIEKLDCVEQLKLLSSLKLMIEIIKKEDPTSLVIVSTLNGSPVDSNIKIMGFNETSQAQFVVPFSVVHLDAGKIVVKFSNSTKLVFVEAKYSGGGDNGMAVVAEDTYLLNLN